MCEFVTSKLSQLLFIRLSAGSQYYECMRGLTPTLVWQSDDCYFLNGRMTQQNSFNLD